MSTPPRREIHPAAPGTGKAAPSLNPTVAARTRRRWAASAHDALPLPAVRANVPPRADATREKLLAATHELLRERVGGPVSVNEICIRAGANVAMVKY